MAAQIDHPIDVIGDVHGMYGRLRNLLSALGYERCHGRWGHNAGNRIVFVGDYVDRGVRPAEVVALVRDLCADDMAIALLGNHDANAIAFCMQEDRAELNPQGAWREGRAALEGTRGSGHWLRAHHKPGAKSEFKNVEQHGATLRGFSDPAAYEAAVRWFATLPAWFELPGLRVVHAAWVPPSIDALDRWAAGHGLPSPGIRAAGFGEALAIQRAREARLPGDRHWYELLDLRGIEHAHREPPDRSPAVALERVVKGIEIGLPLGASFVDQDGHPRREIRMRWFEAAEGRSFAEAALMNPADVERLAAQTAGQRIDVRLPGFEGVNRLVPYAAADAYGPGERPVIFGHYGMRLGGSPERARLLGCAARNVACVDNGVVLGAEKGGALTAYRWAGERQLMYERFVSVGSDDPADNRVHGGSLTDLPANQCVD